VNFEYQNKKRNPTINVEKTFRWGSDTGTSLFHLRTFVYHDWFTNSRRAVNGNICKITGNTNSDRQCQHIHRSHVIGTKMMHHPDWVPFAAVFSRLLNAFPTKKILFPRGTLFCCSKPTYFFLKFPLCEAYISEDDGERSNVCWKRVAQAQHGIKLMTLSSPSHQALRDNDPPYPPTEVAKLPTPAITQAIHHNPRVFGLILSRASGFNAGGL